MGQISPERIIEGNQIIAAFDGGGGDYHSDKRLLKSVIDKIEKLSIPAVESVKIVIGNPSMVIYENQNAPFLVYTGVNNVGGVDVYESKLLAAWVAVVEFVKWFNTLPKVADKIFQKNTQMRICIVVPYRNREEHLKQFIPCMEKCLTDQDLDYTILIVEQEAGKPFNRGKLLNIGFDYTKGEYDNYCFHDVDMLPVDSDYSYCETPTHLAVEVEQFKYKLPFPTYFGGVVIFDRESLKKINGFANEYWGWGSEDSDMYDRCGLSGISMSRKICRYKSLPHGRDVDHEKQSLQNVKLLNEVKAKYKAGKIEDGLSNLSYKIVEVMDVKDSLKHIIVSI